MSTFLNYKLDKPATLSIPQHNQANPRDTEVSFLKALQTTESADTAVPEAVDQLSTQELESTFFVPPGEQ